MNIDIDLTSAEFKRKPFLHYVYANHFALKLYLLSNKSEELLLSAICFYLATKATYHSYDKNKEVVFTPHNKTLDEVVEAVKAFYYRCQNLAVNKNEADTREYWESLKQTIINNWAYFNPSTKHCVQVKFKRTNLRKLY